MGRRTRGLFRTDLGDHPPEIQEFLEEWHHPDHRHWMSRGISSAFGRPSSEEVRQNARWFGAYLLLVAVVVPGGVWWWAGDRLSTVAGAGWAVFAVCVAAIGIALRRSARSPIGGQRTKMPSRVTRSQTSKLPPESDGEPD